MNRKKAIDYKEEYQSLNLNKARLSNQITDRLLDLAKKHPDAPISRYEGNNITAKAIVDQKQYVSNMEIHTRIHYIEAIETYIDSTYNVQQMKIKF